MKEDAHIGCLIKYNSQIFRNLQTYIDKILEKYELSSGTYPYILHLYSDEGITQSRLGCHVGHDKAMSARTITKLIEQGFIYKEIDCADSRAYSLYLTQKGKETAPLVKEDIHALSYKITEGLSGNEKDEAMGLLGKIYNNVLSLKKNGGCI